MSTIPRGTYVAASGKRAIIQKTLDTSWIARMAHVASGTVVSTAKHDIPHMETSGGIRHLLLLLSLSAPVCGCCSASALLLLLLVVALFWFWFFFLFLFPLRASDPFFCGWPNGRFKLFQALIGAIRFDPASFGLVFLGVAIDERGVGGSTKAVGLQQTDIRGVLQYVRIAWPSSLSLFGGFVPQNRRERDCRQETRLSGGTTGMVESEGR